jgi:hypothetical protein
MNYILLICNSFLSELDFKKIYTVIPFISINNRPDQPYIILSQQFLVTDQSNRLLITNMINENINKAITL